MFFTIEEVKIGLAKGQSFKHYFGTKIKPGCEYVRSLGDNCFEHTVDGGDYGGVADMNISVIDKTRWTEDGWELWDPYSKENDSYDPPLLSWE